MVIFNLPENLKNIFKKSPGHPAALPIVETEKLENCRHRNTKGDNHGETCADCGDTVAGFGFGGWFGRNLETADRPKCMHLFWLNEMPDADGLRWETCHFCEHTRPVDELPF